MLADHWILQISANYQTIADPADLFESDVKFDSENGQRSNSSITIKKQNSVSDFYELVDDTNVKI